MESATIIRSLATLSIPQYIIVDYEYDMGSDSTAFISIDLPALFTTEESYRKELRTKLTGKSYAIDLCSFNISSDSTDFNVQLLNKGDVSYIETIYTVIEVLEINKTESNIFDRFIIRNEDSIVTNKFYMKIVNNSVSDIGKILLQLTYITLQNRISE